MKIQFCNHSVMIGLLLGIMASTIPVSSWAAVYWEEGFENGLGAWERGNMSTMAVTDQAAFEGTQSLRLLYSNVNASEGCCVMNRNYPATPEVYVRFYYRLSAGFQASGSHTKIMFIGPYPDYTQYPSIWVGMFETKQLDIVSQGSGGNNGFQNQGTSLTFQDNRWYCVEVHIKDNVVKEGWIDGALKISYPGEPSAGSGHTYSTLQIYQERGNGQAYYDKIAVGNTRIGCSSTSGTTKPSPPTNLSVQ